MPLTREERKLLHQKSKQPTFGSNKPDDREGYEGDVSYRKVEGSGTVQYVKTDGTWNAISSSGTMPSVRMGSGGGGSVTISTGSGVTSHSALDNLDLDDHTQYLLIDGSRAMTNTMLIGSDSDGTDRSIVWGHSTLKTIMGIDDSSDAFVINTDDAFDSTLANNSFSIDANHNVIIAGDVSVGDDLFLTSSGSVINWNSGDVTLTHASGKLTFGGDGTVELDFNNHEMTNVDIDSGDISSATISGGLTWSSAQDLNNQNLTNANIDSGSIDGTTIGSSSATTGAFTTITASTSVDITGSTGLILENDETITNSTNGTVLINGIVSAGTGSAAGVFQSNGDYDVTLQTGNSTTGVITITDGANGNIDITPNGSGSAVIPKVDIGGGEIDGTVIGDNSHTTIKGTTIEATTNFNVSRTTIQSTSWTNTATLTINASTGLNLQENGSNVISYDNNRYIYFHNYGDDVNFQNYSLSNLADKYHFTTGRADLAQNYSILAEDYVSSSFNTAYGT